MVRPGAEPNPQRAFAPDAVEYEAPSGKYGKVLLQYMEDTLKKYDDIDTDRVFITHAGADQEYVDAVYAALKAKGIFKEIHVTRASCTISSHCGPNTLGVLFMTK